MASYMSCTEEARECAACKEAEQNAFYTQRVDFNEEIEESCRKICKEKRLISAGIKLEGRRCFCGGPILQEKMVACGASRCTVKIIDITGTLLNKPFVARNHISPI